MAVDVQKIIDKITSPAIELAGPSPHGYKVLSELGLSIPQFLVTNIIRDVTVYTSDDKPQTHTVDAVIDFRDMPYKNSSVGILLCSYLPATDYPSKHSPQRSEQEIEDEYKNVLASEHKPVLSLNFHIKLLINASEVLAEGGLLILQGLHPKDSDVARKINLKPLLSKAQEASIDSQIYLKPETILA